LRGIHGAISIRLAGPDDIDDLSALEHAAFRDPWAVVSLQEALSSERHAVLIAHRDGAALGYAIASTVSDEAELARIGVATAWRGRGLGRLLLDATVQECSRRGVSRLFLEVRAGNAVARRLYESAGFRQIGLRRQYYGDGEDAIVMEKALED